MNQRSQSVVVPYLRGVAVVALFFALAVPRVALGQLLGDANCDAVVDEADTEALAASVFDPPPSCNGGDANLDGTMSAADFTVLTRHQVSNSNGAAGATVPYLGLAGADGFIFPALGEINRVPVYARGSGFGFRLVLEAQAGSAGIRPGTGVFDLGTNDPATRPDIQVQTSRALGDGSPAICDGGVPAVVPPGFGSGQAITDALNDFACNATAATAPSFACTQDEFGMPRFVSSAPLVQFCVTVSRALAFPPGDTLVTARVRDVLGNLGPEQRMIVRVGGAVSASTFTPTPIRAAASPSASRTATSTVTVTATPTRTVSPVATATRTSTVTSRPSVTFTETPVPPTATATRTLPFVSPTTAPPTVPGATRTRTPTPTRSATPAITLTNTATVTSTPTATVAAAGPVVTHFGLTRSDDTPVESTATLPDGTLIFQLNRGLGFAVVIEARRGTSGADVGCLAFREADSRVPDCAYPDDSVLPDLQVVVSNPLGNGSSDVCDSSGSFAGGVPAVDPPSFGDSEAAAINDLACRFVDGANLPLGRGADDSCVSLPTTGEYKYVGEESWIQFCTAKITTALEFPAGDTRITARLRDKLGKVGPPASIIVRIGT